MASSFEAVVEYRPNANCEWAPATLHVQIVTSADTSALVCSVVDCDGETKLFTTPLVSPLAMQVVATKLDSDRLVVIYDEPNDHEAFIRFADRQEANIFMSSLVAASFRVRGCASPQVFLINEDEVRKAKGIEPSQTYSVHVELLRASLFDPRTAVYRQDLIADGGLSGSPECKCNVSVGGGDQSSGGDGNDAVMAAFLSCKEGLKMFIAVDAPKLRSGSIAWLPDALKQALSESDEICSFLLQVTSLEVSDDAKKESIRKRLQRQGAQSVGNAAAIGTPMGKPLRHVTASNDSFGAVAAAAATSETRRSFSSAPQPQPTSVEVAASSVSESIVAEAQSAAAAVDGDATTSKGSQKKEKRRKDKSVEREEATAAYEEEAAAVTETKPKKSSKSNRESSVASASAAEAAAVVDASPEEEYVRYGSPTSPAVQDADYHQQLVDFQLKLERKKQRILKLEAEILGNMESVEHSRKLQEVKAAEIGALRAALDADRAQFSQQQDAFRIQQFTFYQQQQEEEDRKAGGKGGGAVKRVTRPGMTMAGGTTTATNNNTKGEKEPLIANAALSMAYSVQGPESTYVLRIDHPFYDNSSLPPAIERCYPVTAAFLQASHHPAGSVFLLLVLGAGIGLVAWSIADDTNNNMYLWPTIVLFAMAMAVQLATLRHKTALYDGVHRLDQSCSQFDNVAFIYRRTTLFTLLPIGLVLVSLCSLFVLLATNITLWARIGLLIGALGCTISFGVFSLFLLLVASVAWDRVGAVVPLDAGNLCSRLAVRRVVAQYQYVKQLVAATSKEWSFDIFLVVACMFLVMLFCVYGAIEVHSFARLVALNCVFSWAAGFSFCVLRAVCGWQRATLCAMGTVAAHCDRWARGDYNAEGADVRLEDYVSLQQSLYLMTKGSSYAKWTMQLLDDESTIGRVWMWSCGALTLASLIMIPISVLYQFESWDG